MMVRELQEMTHNKSKQNIRDYYTTLGEINPSGMDGHNHEHRCDFEMLYNERTAKKMCKQYLKSKGMKRDKYMCCCDMAEHEGVCCKHLRFVLLDEDNVVIAIE